MVLQNPQAYNSVNPGKLVGNAKKTVDSNDEFFDYVSNRVLERFGPSLCNILGRTPDDQLAQCGMGTLLAVAERIFLVTAAHVPMDTADAKFRLYLCDYVMNGIAPVIPIAGASCHSIRRNLDLAVIELPEDIMAKMPKRRPIRLSDFSMVPRTDSDGFLICGVPNSLSEMTENRTFGQWGVRFWTKEKSADGLCIDKFDKSFHMLFELPSDGISDDGLAFPSDLRGISGCPIWRAYSGEDPNEWTDESIKIAAFQTGVYRQNDAIKGTLWGGLLMLLWKGFEELRPSIEFHLPATVVHKLKQ